MDDRDFVIEVLVAATRRSEGNIATRLCEACLEFLSVDGAWLSLIAIDGTRNTIGATDETATRLDELEFTVGQGPGTDAFATGTPVLVQDIETVDPARWPLLTGGSEFDVRAVFVLPLQVGAIRLGVLGFYRRAPVRLTATELAHALRVADVITMLMLNPSSDGLADDFDQRWLEGSLWDREVSQATGMITVQLNITIEDALARLRAHAFSQGRPISEVARDVVARRLRLPEGG